MFVFKGFHGDQNIGRSEFLASGYKYISQFLLKRAED